MSGDCKEEKVPKQVIENQLLASLDDKAKVALILDEDDLKALIYATGQLDGEPYDSLRKDMEQLWKGAFSK